jgi:hypothetical protein
VEVLIAGASTIARRARRSAVAASAGPWFSNRLVATGAMAVSARASHLAAPRRFPVRRHRRTRSAARANFRRCGADSVASSVSASLADRWSALARATRRYARPSLVAASSVARAPNAETSEARAERAVSSLVGVVADGPPTVLYEASVSVTSDRGRPPGVVVVRCADPGREDDLLLADPGRVDEAEPGRARWPRCCCCCSRCSRCLAARRAFSALAALASSSRCRRLLLLRLLLRLRLLLWPLLLPPLRGEPDDDSEPGSEPCRRPRRPRCASWRGFCFLAAAGFDVLCVGGRQVLRFFLFFFYFCQLPKQNKKKSR